MPLSGNKAATTPFQTMDIKTALLSGGSRKRKASLSQVVKNDVKSAKLSFEKSDNENDVEILDEVCGIIVTLDQSALEKSPGDCKENKDLNTSKTPLEISSGDCKENRDVNTTKDELSPTVNKTSLAPKLTSPLSSQGNSKKDDEHSLSEMSQNSENSSCDERNASNLNSSINVSLNTSGLSITGDEKEVNTISKITDDCSDKAGKSKDTETIKVKKKKMTPAEAMKRTEEREQKQKEKMTKKQELENKRKERLLEKERKLKEKLLQKEREELERKERERIKQEKKEQEEKEKLQKQKEKEEKLKVKNMMLEAKLEEKKKKEDMKRKREEELKKAEEDKLKAKLEKEQKEQEKKERAKAAFLKFFVSGDTQASTPAAQATERRGGTFKPFQISEDMILAPVVPPAAQERFDKKQLDHYLEFQDDKESYLQILRSGSYKDVRQRKRNKKIKSSDAEVIIIDQNAQAELRLSAKLLQFHDNVRPPYWGTWRKKSKNIRPRNPFGEDAIFDYSVDSDDEWDEGGPGESLSGTEQEDESEDDYEVDNEFFVPHGYLSDEEIKDEDDEEVNDPEKQKALLKRKLQEFEMEHKKKTAELKPIVIGCYHRYDPNFQDPNIKKLLSQYTTEILTDEPIPTSFNIKKLQLAGALNKGESPHSNSGNSAAKKKKSIPEDAYPQLIRLVHGSVKNRKILAEEFQRYWNEQSVESSETRQKPVEPPSSIETNPLKDAASEVSAENGQLSLRQLSTAIRTIACYGKSPEPTFNKHCWWVHENIREKYGLLDAPLPNQWNYVSQKVDEKHVAAAKGNSTSIKGFLSPSL